MELMTRQEVLREHLMGHTVAPDTKWHKWATVYKSLKAPSLFSLTGRRINNFCVGSDPEFALLCERNGDRFGAYDAGLKVGLAAGCDQNERLVELRPWPSTSVVTHVAGILTDLRWLYRVHPHAANCFWRAGAFYSGDGMGGHVHFGRKRPTRPAEIQALDGLARVMKSSGMFPTREWDLRIKGDRLGQRYGLPGDFRPQAHGYEYRSLPSWLLSPEVAFVSITASKLAVIDPSITTEWRTCSLVNGPEQARDLLRGLAKLYRGRDDDAYLMYHILTRYGDTFFQVDWSLDFKPNWGIPPAASQTRDESGFILPATIKPHEAEIREIVGHLLFGNKLTFESHPPNFKTKIPANYIWLPARTQPGRRAGYGDLLHNLVTSRKMSIAWDFANNGLLRVGGALPRLWTKADIKLLKDYCNCSIEVTKSEETYIIVPRELCQTHTIAGLRAILIHSGLFPIWTVDTVEENSVDKWLMGRKEVEPIGWRKI